MKPQRFDGDRTELGLAAGECAKAHPVIDLIYAFGSVVKDRATAESDLDLAVLLDYSMPRSERGRIQSKLICFFCDRLHCDLVDVVILNDAPPLLEFQVINHGILLFAGTAIAPHNYQVRALSRYFDIQPMIAFHRQGLYQTATTK